MVAIVGVREWLGINAQTARVKLGDKSCRWKTDGGKE